jgi:hypothetical protein
MNIEIMETKTLTFLTLYNRQSSVTVSARRVGLGFGPRVYRIRAVLSIPVINFPNPTLIVVLKIRDALFRSFAINDY